ncbi:uncharacterized protein LOC120337379 isoform X3 [Styela clava]
MDPSKSFSASLTSRTAGESLTTKELGVDQDPSPISGKISSKESAVERSKGGSPSPARQGQDGAKSRDPSQISEKSSSKASAVESSKDGSPSPARQGTDGAKSRDPSPISRKSSSKASAVERSKGGSPSPARQGPDGAKSRGSDIPGTSGSGHSGSSVEQRAESKETGVDQDCSQILEKSTFGPSTVESSKGGSPVPARKRQEVAKSKDPSQISAKSSSKPSSVKRGKGGSPSPGRQRPVVAKSKGSNIPSTSGSDQSGRSVEQGAENKESGVDQGSDIPDTSGSGQSGRSVEQGAESKETGDDQDPSQILEKSTFGPSTVESSKGGSPVPARKRQEVAKSKDPSQISAKNSYKPSWVKRGKGGSLSPGRQRPVVAESKDPSQILDKSSSETSAVESSNNGSPSSAREREELAKSEGSAIPSTSGSDQSGHSVEQRVESKKSGVDQDPSQILKKSTSEPSAVGSSKCGSPLLPASQIEGEEEKIQDPSQISAKISSKPSAVGIGKGDNLSPGKQKSEGAKIEDSSQISEKSSSKPSAVESSSKGGSPSPAQEKRKVAKSKGSDIPGTSGSDQSGRSVEQGAESKKSGVDQDPSQISGKSSPEPNAIESSKGGSPSPARKRQEVAKSEDPSQISEIISPKPSAVESSKGGSSSPAQERQKVAKSKDNEKNGSDIPGTSGSDQSGRSVEQRAESKESVVDRGSDIPGTSGSGQSGRSVEQRAESKETGVDPDPSQISEKSTSEPSAVESSKGGSPSPARKRQEVAKSKDPSQISAKSSSKPSSVKRGKGGSSSPGMQRPVVAKSKDPSQISGKISSELSAVESSKGGIPSPARQRSEMTKIRGSDIPVTSGSDHSGRSVEQRVESKESGVDQDATSLAQSEEEERVSNVTPPKLGASPFDPQSAEQHPEPQGARAGEDATSLAQSEEEERVSNVPPPKLGASPFDPQSAEQHPEPQGATAGDNERFEDACTDILKKFPTFKHFKMFAQAGTGLTLSINEISTIIEDNASSVEDQKFEMLQLWKEKNGSHATSRYIREVVEKHRKAENSGVTGPRIEDAFLKVPKVFANAAQFKRFALSRKGLSLSMLEVENIKDNARFVEERNLQMLTQWKYKNGESATTKKIWQLVDGFLNEDGSEQDSPHPTTLSQSVEEERVSNVPLSSSLSQSADQFSKPEGSPGGEVARCEEPKRVSSVPSPQLGASPFGSRSSEPLVDTRGATGGEAAIGSGSMTPSGAHEHQGTSATVPTTPILHHNTPDRHRSSDTQPANTSSEQEAAVGGGSYTEKVQEFKDAINDLTRRSAKPIEKKYLKTPDYKTNPKTVEVDYYETTVQESEYKPEVGFSQQTQKQPGNPISMENFFSNGKSRVALIGGAGYGKTEMTKTYPVNVLDGKIPELRKVEVVRRMDFRDLEVHRRISPKNFLFGKTDLNDDVIDMGVGWIREYPERFLLVLDGADQYSFPESLGIPHGECNHTEKADPKLILNLILAGKLYPGIRILYSSREHVIRNFEGKARPERVIALAGFSEEDVIKLVKAFSGDKSAYVMNRLQNEAKAIFSLCSIPMFLIFTVSVLIIYEQYSPDTMTEVLLFVLRDTLRSEHITMNQMKTGMSIYDVVHSLKEMSFKGTKNKKVTFTKSDLPPGITVDHFKDIMVPFPGSIGLNQRLLEGHLVYLFTHQTIQEALTALCIAEMSIWKFRKFVSTKIHEKHWVVVRKILCGIILNPKTSNIAMEKEADVGILKSDIDLEKKRSILLSSMKNQFRPGWFQRKIKGREAVRNEDLLELMHVLNESGDGVNNIIKSSIREIDFSYMTLTPSDKYTLASILARCSRLDSLDLDAVPLTSSDLALLASSMQRSNIKIKQIRFGEWEAPLLSHDEAVAFCDMLSHITGIMILDYTVEPEEIEMIQRKLDSIPTTELEVWIRWSMPTGEDVTLRQKK